MEIWMVQLCVVIILATLCGALAERIGQSRVVGEIAAGLVLGPSILGAIDIGLYRDVFPNPAMPAISKLWDLGLIFLMFQMGLHLDLKSLKMRSQAHVPVLIALFGIVGSFAIGSAIGVISRPVFAAKIPMLSYVLFCGIALSISAVPVMARIVTDLRIGGMIPATIALR